MMRQSQGMGTGCHSPSRRVGMTMTAELIIFEPNRSTRSDSVDEADRLLSALGEYTSAELLELLYVGQEPGFFELVRGVFALSEESRLALQNFLANTARNKSEIVAFAEGGQLFLQNSPINPETGNEAHRAVEVD